MAENPLDPAVLTGLDLPEARLRAIAAAFGDIRREIAKLREYDLGETHPAVVFRHCEGARNERG